MSLGTGGEGLLGPTVPFESSGVDLLWSPGAQQDP